MAYILLSILPPKFRAYGIQTSYNIKGCFKSKILRSDPKRSYRSGGNKTLRITYGRLAGTGNTVLHLQRGAEGGLH